MRRVPRPDRGCDDDRDTVCDPLCPDMRDCIGEEGICPDRKMVAVLFNTTDWDHEYRAVRRCGLDDCTLSLGETVLFPATRVTVYSAGPSPRQLFVARQTPPSHDVVISATQAHQRGGLARCRLTPNRATSPKGHY